MSYSEKIEIFNAIGTWLAAIGTLSAVFFSLYMVKRQTKADLIISVGARALVYGDGTPPIDIVCFSVTNKGLNPVVITNIGWRVGKGKNKRSAIQTVGTQSNSIPMELTHGKSGSFTVEFEYGEHPWLKEFAEKFIENSDDKHLKTLEAFVGTSIETIWLKPEKNLLKAIKDFLENTNS